MSEAHTQYVPCSTRGVINAARKCGLEGPTGDSDDRKIRPGKRPGSPIWSAIFALLAWLGAAVSPASAAIFTWNASALGPAWNVTSNWGGSVPGSGDTALFNAGSYSLGPTLSNAASLGGLWDSGSGSLTIGGTSALTLSGTTINGNTGTGIEIDTGAGPLTVNIPLVLQNTQTWINNSASAMTVNGNISGISSSALTLTGSGLWTLSGTSSNFSGNMTVNGGTLQVPGGSLATGILYVGSSGSATLNQLAGTYSTNGNALYVGSGATANGTYNFSSGMLAVGSTEYVGYSGSGALNQSGGTNNTGTYLYLGYSSGGNGTYNLSGSGVITGNTSEQVGYNGSGTFTQSGGINACNSQLILGAGATGSGTYTLSGGSLAGTSLQEYVGFWTSGTFNQSGGTNNAPIALGWFAGSGGTYNLSGSGLLLGHAETVGNGGSGTLIQSGGTNSATSLTLGNNAGVSGTYNLSGTGLLSGSTETVGQSGSGAFTQSGGSNSATALNLGYNAGSSGSYSLGPTAALSSGTLTVGYAGSGTFNQSGGTNSVGNGGLYLGYNSNSSGSYSLSGSGILLAGAEYIGSSGSGAFQQSGGSNSVGYLTIGSLGSYQYGGGTLQVTGAGLVNQGVFNALGYAGTLSVTGSAVVDLSAGTLQNIGALSLNIGPNSLLLLPAGLDPQTAFANYSNAGLVHNAGTPLTISAGQNFLGNGAISDLVNCQGTISAVANGALNLNNGLTVSGTGSVSLGNGTFTVNDTSSGITSGSLSAAGGYVGTGTFTQSGGTNSARMYLGNATGSSGTYVLSGSGLLIASQVEVGVSGSGTFNQSGGTYNVGSGGLYLGYNSNGSGTYNLTGGSLNGTITVGNAGNGTFNQSGGTNSSTTSGVTVANGSYNLSASGLLTDSVESVGNGAVGTFTQSGGTNQVASISLGQSSGSGSYSLSGNSLFSPNAMYLGNSGTGSFTQSGGMSNVGGGGLFVGYNNSSVGIYNQSGGTNNVAAGGLTLGGNGSFGYGSSGSYNLSGSGLLIANGAILGYHGIGTFTQSGGTSNLGSGALTIGEIGGGSSYSLSGAGLLSAGQEIAGYQATAAGAITQSGGTNNIGSGGLWLGYYSQNGQLSNDASGTYNLSGSGVLLSAGTETVGYGGMGLFTQSGGTNMVGSGGLYLGYAFVTGSGSYNLSGSGLLTGGSECIGYQANGAFTQTGGTNNLGSAPLYLGYSNRSGSGSYSLSGAGFLSAGTETIGLAGSGTFTQSGGANSTSSLVLAQSTSATGGYNLNGGLLTIGSGGITRGPGSATFTFGGGTLAASAPWSSTLAMNLSGSGGNGTIDTTGGNISLTGNLSGPGGLNKVGPGALLLSGSSSFAGTLAIDGGSLQLPGSSFASGSQSVGYTSTASLAQSGGTNTVAGSLFVAGTSSLATAQGTYLLSGPSLLTVSQNEAIGGGGGTGSFVQSAGTNSVAASCLVGTGGSYTLAGGLQQAGYLGLTGGRYLASGGTLQVNGGLQITAGTFGGGGGAAAIVANGVVDLSGGSLLQTDSLSLSMGTASLLILPSSGTLDPNAAFATFSNPGLTHTAGTTLTVAANQTIIGLGNIVDPVVVQGTLGVPGNATLAGLTLSGSFNLSGTGSVNLGSGGSLIVDTLGSAVTSGSLNTGSLIVGNSGATSFAHSGGTISSTALYLGYNPGSNGTYALSNSAALAAITEYIGYSGSGALTQTGGTNTVAGAIYLGSNAGGTGSYNLYGGLLVATNILQGSGSAALNITSGSLTGGTSSLMISVPMVLTTAGSSGTLIASGSSLTLAGQISGSGGIVKSGSSTVVLAANNIYTGSTLIAQGVLQLANANATQDTTVTVGVNNGLAFSGSGSYNVGSISGSGNLVLASSGNKAVTLVTGGNNDTTTYSGVISGSGTLVHNGSGTLELAGSNTYSGGTVLGPDNLVDDNSLALGTGSLTVAGNATWHAGASFGFSNPIVLSPSVTGTFDTQGYTTTVNGSIAGSGNLNKAGAGTLVLASSSSFTGNTSISQGTLQVASATALQNSTVSVNVDYGLQLNTLSAALGGLSGAGALNLITGGTFSVGGDNGDTTYSGPISGGGTLVKSGTGSLDLSGTSTWTGGIILDPGILAINSDAALGDPTGLAHWGGGNANIIFAANSTLQARNSFPLSASRNIVISTSTTATLDAYGNTFTIGGVISGSGALAVVGSGTLVLANSETFSGGTTISSSATLQVDSGGASGALNGNIADSGLLVFDRSDNPTFSGAISGSGSVEQAGAGTLFLGGTNTFGGSMILAAGTLKLASSRALQGPAGLVFSGGSLNLNGFPAALGAVSGTGSLALGSGTLTIGGNSANSTFGGSIGGGGGLVMAGSGMFTLTGSNTYTGGTTLSAGTLAIASDAALGAVPGSPAINVTFSGNSTLAGFPPVGGGSFALSASRNIAVNTGATAAFNPQGNTLTIGGVISGAGGLSVFGNGTLVLANTDTYSGGTTLAAGTLQVGNAYCLQNTTVTLSGGSLNLNNLNATLGGLSGTGSLPLGSGTLTVGSNTCTYAGILSGPGSLTKAGAGLFALTGSNLFTGGTTLSAGTLAIGSDAALGAVPGSPATTVSFSGNSTLAAIASFALSASRNIAINTGATATFNPQGNSLTIGGIISGAGALAVSGSGTLILTNSETYSGGTTINAAATLQIDNGGSTGALNGSITDNGTLIFNRSDSAASFSGMLSGNGSLQQAGSGTLLFGGVNSFSGTATLSAGTLRLGSATALQNSTLALSGGTLDLNSFNATLGALSSSGNLVLGSGTLTVGGNNNTTTYAGILSGPGSLNKGVNGLLALTASNLFTGGTVLSSGTLAIGSDAALGAVPGSPATNVTFSGNSSLAAGSSLALSASRNIVIGTGTTATFNPQGNTLTLGGIISGSGILAVSGSGTLVLTNSETYSGGTTINATATLQVDNGGSTGALNGSIADNGTLIFDRSDNAASFSGMLSGNGALQQAGTGTLLLGGTNSFSGTTTLSAGTLQLGSATALQNSTVALSGGTLNLNSFNAALGALSGTGNLVLGNGTLTVGGNNNTTTYAGILSGPGSLNKGVNGSLALTASNLFTGGTVLSGGTLAIGSDAALGAVPGSPATNVTFSGNSSLAAGSSLALSASRNIVIGTGTTATFNPQGNTLTLGGVVSGSGGLSVVGGGLVVLANAETYTGATMIGSGTLQVGSGGAGAALASASISNSGTLDFNHNDALTVSAAISGSGGLYNMGGGTLTLTGSNTFSGPASVIGGSLVGSTMSLPGAISLANNANVVLNQTASGTLGNIVSGTGGLTKAGTGTLTLTASQSYSGPTVIAGGTLKLQSLAALPTISGTGIALERWYDAQTNASLVTSGGTVTSWNDLSGQGANATNSGSGSTGGQGAPLYVTSGSNTINGHPAVWFGNSGGNDLGFSAAGLASGANPSTVFAVGQLTGNSSTWGWLFGYGAPNTGNAREIGANSGTNRLNCTAWGADATGPVLSYNPPTPVVAACVFGGSGNSVQSNWIYNGSTGSSTANLTLTTGTLGGHIGARVDGGTEYWYGSVGEVLVYNGALTAAQQQQVEAYLNYEWLGSGGSATGSLPATTPLQLATSGAVFDLGGGPQTVATLADYPVPGASSGTVLNSSVYNTSTLTLGAGGSTTFSGAILGGGTLGKINLVMSGSGTQILAGSNTYTGPTTISAGTLQLGSGGTTGALSTSSNITDNGALAFNLSNSVVQGVNFANAISGSGGLVQLGSGTLSLMGGNTYRGATTLIGGALVAGAVNALSPSSAMNITGGTLDVSRYAQTVSSLTVGAAGTLVLCSSNLLTALNPSSLNGALDVLGQPSGGSAELISFPGTYSGSFSSTLSIVPNGYKLQYNSNNHELDLVSAGPPTWAVTIGVWSDGTHWSTGAQPNGPAQTAVLSNATSANSPVSVTLDVPVTLGALTLGNSDGSTAGFALSAASTQTLTLDNSGSTALIQVTSGTQQSISAPLVLAGTLSVVPSAGTTLGFSGNMSEEKTGAGVLALNGPGTLVLSGTNNSYRGGTYVAEGTLYVTTFNAIPNGTSLAIGAGGLFIFDPTLGGTPLDASLLHRSSARISPVPEPGTLALLSIAGVAGAAVVWWRRRDQ